MVATSTTYLASKPTSDSLAGFGGHDQSAFEGLEGLVANPLANRMSKPAFRLRKISSFFR